MRRLREFRRVRTRVARKAGILPQAISEFTCVIEAEPTEAEGYRGRIEAQLLLGQSHN
jgi:hypothetical protein